MTKEQILTNIESLLPILHNYMKTGTAKITVDEQLLLKDVYSQVYPGVSLVLSCSSCVTTALHYLAAYHDRESKTIEPAATIEPVKEEPVAPVKKTRRKK